MGAFFGHRIGGVSAAFVLCMTVSCEDDLVISTPVDTPIEEAPIEWSIDYQAEGFIGIEAAGGSPVAVGGAGTYQLDGSTWSRIAAGVGARDISLGKDQALFALAGTALYRRDGENWTNVRTFQSTSEYWSIPAVWAHTSQNVFVITTEQFEAAGIYYWVENTLHHFDGNAWTTSPLPANIAIHDMWGASPSSIYVAGSDGLYHYDGTATTKIDAAGATALRSISGTSDNDFYAIRSDGSILFFDGIAFGSLPAPAEGLRAARRIGGDLFVCGYAGTCYRYVGGSWVSMFTGPSDHLLGIWGTSATDVVTIGSGGILQMQDGGWRRARGGASSPLRDLWVAPTGEVFVVGDNGVIELRDADGWRPMGYESRVSLNGVAGMTRDNVYAVGAGGRILHYDGTTWSAMTAPTAAGLNALWVHENGAVAVGGATAISLEDGVWNVMPGPYPSRFRFVDVWGTSEDDVFAVGYSTPGYDGGGIFHYDGTAWSKVDSEIRPRMFGVWGFAPNDVYAVGAASPQDGSTRFRAAAVYHFDGVSWNREIVPEGVEGLASIWGTSIETLVGVGHFGLTIYDGSKWHVQAFEVFNGHGLDDVSSAGGADVFALGSDGVIRFQLQR